MLHKSKKSAPFWTFLYLFLFHTVFIYYLSAILIYILFREFLLCVHLFFRWSIVWYDIVLCIVKILLLFHSLTDSLTKI